MKLKLGIDTGGSYTDAVLVDYESEKVVSKAKAKTTKQNLTIGIEEAIDKLKIGSYDQIVLVCLSTTLATNAVVEGKGANVGLITIDEPKASKYPVLIKKNVKGKIDVKGCEVNPLDVEAAREALLEMKGRVEALAISGYASVRNPVYELKVKELADEILGVPVICAYEMTNVLGYYERTITAALNAKLIPVIKNLIAATKQVLASKGIGGNLVIIKGDGNCMGSSFAEERPIETVLSGPAASSLGGLSLTDEENVVIADMGGTTLDIVPVVNKVIPIDKQGATVGGWRTRVKAMHTRSYGLGGDSYMRINSSGAIDFGPERATPLCVANELYPNLLREIEKYTLPSNYHIVRRQELDCIALFKRENIYEDELSRDEKEIVKILQDGAHSLIYVAEMVGKDIDSISIMRLLRSEIIYLISFTPTDLLHATGQYIQYNPEISEIAIEKLAARLKCNVAEFAKKAREVFVEKICVAIIECLLAEKGVKENQISTELIECLINTSCENDKLLDFKCIFNAPLIGLGAPAGVWLREAGQRLGCKVIIPEHSEVANAIGTVSGNIRETLEALIRYDSHIKKFIVHLPDRRATFDTLERAKSFCEKALVMYGNDFAKKIGVCKYTSRLNYNEVSVDSCQNAENTFVELRIKLLITANAENVKID